MLTDYVSGASVTLSRNPTYWGYDERYPKNQLPYLDTVKILIIPDAATTLAAIRTGKIDAADNLSLQQAQQMKKTNPEIIQIGVPYSCLTIDPRFDSKPFSDEKVRQAMQQAIDLPTIAATYYGGTSPADPSSLTSMYETGWAYPYNQWPQDLKDSFAYDPAAAKKLLSDAGYPTGFNTDVVADAAGDLDLLQIVKSYFAAVGINMEIRTMDSASWTAFVRNGHKYDALAYRSSGQIGMSYEPIRQFSRYTTGYVANYTLVSDPTIDGMLPKALASTDMNYIKQLLQDENKYFAQQHFEISLIYANTFSVCQPWLKGFSAQNAAISSGSSGPMTLGFYASRFWVDQKLKKSLGK
jgi:ABC-type transport system substrate-binding protein